MLRRVYTQKNPLQYCIAHSMPSLATSSQNLHRNVLPKPTLQKEPVQDYVPSTNTVSLPLSHSLGSSSYLCDVVPINILAINFTKTYQ